MRSGRCSARWTIAIVLLLALPLGAGAAGNLDATFGPMQELVTAWLTGYLGKVFVLASLLIGMGVAVATQSQIARLVAMTIALAAAFGPGVLTSVFSATL